MNNTNALQERDATKPATHQGAFRKYDVRRVDGKQDPEGAEYFVLRVGDPLIDVCHPFVNRLHDIADILLQSLDDNGNIFG